MQDELLERLRAAVPANPGWRSFYSSLAGGIVTDSALMLLPIDDHMVHRGHAGAKRRSPRARCFFPLKKNTMMDKGPSALYDIDYCRLERKCVFPVVASKSSAGSLSASKPRTDFCAENSHMRGFRIGRLPRSAAVGTAAGTTVRLAHAGSPF